MTDHPAETEPGAIRYAWWAPVGLAGAWLAAIVTAVALLGTLTAGTTRPMSLSRATFAAANAGSLTGFRWNWGEPLDQPGVAVTIILLTAVGFLASWLIPYVAFLGLVARGGSGPSRSRSMAGLFVPVILILVAVVVAWSGGLASESEESPRGLSIAAAGIGLLAGAGASGTSLDSQDATFWWVAMPLHLLGLLGPLLTAWWVAGERLRTQIRLTLVAAAGFFLVGAGLLLLTTAAASGEEFVRAVAVSTDARSAGFLEETKSLPRAARLALAPLALLGGLGGVGGGLKVIAAGVLGIGVWRLVRGRQASRLVGIAGAWLGVVALIAFSTLLGLTALLPELPVDRLWMLVCGATGNVALSHDPVVAAGWDGYVLALAMVISRLAGWTVLWLSVWLGDEPVALG